MLWIAREAAAVGAASTAAVCRDRAVAASARDPPRPSLRLDPDAFALSMRAISPIF